MLSIGLVAVATLSPTDVHAVRAARPRIVRLVLDETTVSPATSPDFDPDTMLRLLRSRGIALVGCYEREARANNLGDGTIVLVATLHPDSSTTATLHTDGLSRPNVASCTTRIVSGFRFNPGPGRDTELVLRLRYERTRAIDR